VWEGGRENGCFVTWAFVPSMLMTIVVLAVAFLAGALVTMQIGSNARLRDALGHALPAVIVSSTLGIVLLAGAMLMGRLAWPSASTFTSAPSWAWLGGAFGAIYAIVTILLARHVGAATLTALVVAGQLICSVVLDHFGVLGFDVRPLTIWRGIGCALLLGGVFLIWRY
jgi:transporter family-2 protein